MADGKKPDPPQIKAYDRRGEKITISKDEIGQLYALGGRVAKVDEVKAAELEAEFDKQTTAQKVGGVLLQGPAALSPSLMAGKRGAEAGFTAGLAAPLEAKAAEAIVPGAGKAMARRELDLKEAHEGAYGVGEAAGMVGSALASGGTGAAGAAAKAIPGVGISAIGGAVERGVAGRLAGLAAKGTLGRAAATAAEIGARGAVEGGAFAAAQAASEQVLADPDLSAQKLFTADGLTAVGKAGLVGAGTGFLGGAALGGAGSLAASGARKAFGGLARVMSKGEPAAAELVAKEAGVAERSAMLPAEPTGVVPGSVTERGTLVSGQAPVSGEPILGTLEREVAAATKAGEAEALQAANRNPTKDWLMKQSHGLAFDALNATKKQGLDAIEHVKGGREAVGEYVQREIISKNPNMFRAGLNGRADDLYQAIQADKYGRIRQGLSDAIKAHPARVNVEELATIGQQMHAEMIKDPTRVAGADPFLGRIMQEAGAVGRSGKIAADGTMDAAESYYLRAALEKRAYEVGKQSSAAAEAYKQFLRKWDDVTVRALDEAAEKAGKGGGRDEILKWKREYQLASAAEEAAKHGADRVIGNNAIGLREGIGAAVAIASGHIFAGPAAAIAMKVAKERGKAVGAFALAKLAERDALAKWVQKVDSQIGKASKGLLDKPSKGVRDPMPPTRALSRTALAKVAEFQADPESYIDRVARQHESLAAHSPEIAESLTAKHVQAMTFLASKVPVSPDPDPLDPHPAPALTRGEEAELGRYWWYVEKPSRFYAEVARGKLTYEGAEVAQALTPGAFEQLQAQTAEALTERLAKGERLPFRQRQVLGVLLDFAATPSQRPEHARFLQQNAITPEPPPPPAPRRAAPNPSQRTSSYDRLEADGPGRR